MSPRTCKYHGDAAPSAGYYRCTCEMRPRPTSCRQDPHEEHPACFVPLPAAAPDPVPVEGTPCAGCGTITPESDLWEPSATDRIGRPHLLAGEFYCRTCLGLAAAPEPDPVPSSRPVTFADVLRYHRKKASDNRADQAWHEEAVMALLDAECRGCESRASRGEINCDECANWQARKAVEVE